MHYQLRVVSLLAVGGITVCALACSKKEPEKSDINVSDISSPGAEASRGAGSPSRGAVVFNRCASCHAVDPEKKSAIGPNLFDVVGREAGTAPGFAYSPAMAHAGLVWTPAKLDAFIAKPSATIKGNRMLFPGIPNAADRADLIAFLATKKKK